MNLWSPELWPYLIPLGLVAVFASLQIGLLLIGGISFDLETDVDLDLDVDVDVDLDVDLDVDVDADLDLDVDADTDVDVHAGGSGGHGLLVTILSPLGLGRVPLSILLQAFGASWGITGVAANYGMFAHFETQALWFLAVTAPIALIGAVIGTRSLVRLLEPLFRVTGKAESRADILGRTGRVTSLQVDHEYGEVCLEINGAPNYVVVRGRGELMKRDETVVVVGFDVDAQRPIVSRQEELLNRTATSRGE